MLDLHARRQAEGDGALDGVDAVVRGLGDDVPRGLDDVGVVAGAARHGILAGAAVQTVAADVPSQGVVQLVAGCVYVALAGQGELFEIGTEAEGDGRLDQVDAARGLAVGLDDLVTAVVHDVGVAAVAAGQGVATAAAIEKVRCIVAGE